MYIKNLGSQPLELLTLTMLNLQEAVINKIPPNCSVEYIIHHPYHLNLFPIDEISYDPI